MKVSKAGIIAVCYVFDMESELLTKGKLSFCTLGSHGGYCRCSSSHS
jgi:hypothetical protein